MPAQRRSALKMLQLGKLRTCLESLQSGKQASLFGIFVGEAENIFITLLPTYKGE